MAVRCSDSDSEPGPLEDFQSPVETHNDTNAEQYAAGRDLQNIPWERFDRTRSAYREQRVQAFRNYTNVMPSEGAFFKQYLEELSHVAVKPERRTFFDFFYNARRIQSSIVHFQLRNLLSATSKHDLYTMRQSCIHHWDLMSYRCTKVLNLQGGATGPRTGTIGPVNISTLSTGRELLVAGGFSGQMVVQRLTDLEIVHQAYVTQSENGITNAIEVFGPDLRILISNNDAYVRIYDTSTFKPQFKFGCEWPVNYATVSPDNQNLIAAVGDDLEGLLVDSAANRVVARLRGHEDFSFAAAWNPAKPWELATGNQDVTTRLWDIRAPEKERKILKGRMGAIRSLRFSSDGAYLMMAEPTDFVHVFDVQSDYGKCQEVDLFGEISGIAFAPDASMFFVSIFDDTYGSVIQFRKKPTDMPLY